MGYLLAKIAILLLLSAIAGALLMYWWLRRRYQDVSGELAAAHGRYQTCTDALASLRQRYEALVAEQAQGDSFDTDWANKLDAKLQLVHSNVRLMEEAVRGIDPNESLRDLSRRLVTLEAQLAAQPDPEPTDLTPVLAAIGGLRLTQSQATDLTPILDAIHNINIPDCTCAETDLSPVLMQLAALRTQLEQQPKAPADPLISYRIAGSSNRLTQAAFGTPDNLQVIKGIGPVLEGFLHNLGVYYFWQIADWTPQDVANVDALLEVFQGRIARDQWVSQAVALAQLPTSVQHP